MAHVGYQREVYQAHMPPLKDGWEARHHPVVIAGGGPVGLSAALALARYGVPSLVLEADDGTCVGSRAICVSRRSLEIFSQLGVADAVVEKGLGWTGGRSFYHGEEVLHFSMPHDEAQRFPPMINIQQYYVEQFLLDEIGRHPELIEVRWQSSVEDVSQNPDHPEHVELRVATPQGGYRLRADWLIGADGGRSRVRECLGLALRGTQYEGRYVIVDVRLKSERGAERLAWFDPPSNPGSTIIMHKQPDDVWRIDYQLRDDEDSEEAVKPENVLPRVRSHLAMIGETASWEPLWISIYNAKCLSLPSYVEGRVAFAGDAAHLVPIFGVRGMNSGIEDAFNLGWKLGFVCRGWAPAELLESYSRERHYAAGENMRQGAKSTEFMAPPDYGFRLLREAVLGVSRRHPQVRSLINPRQSTSIVLSHSPLNGADEDFEMGPVPGEVVPEVPLLNATGAATFLSQVLPHTLCAVYFGQASDLPSGIAAQLDTARLRGLPIAMIAISWDDAVRAHPALPQQAGARHAIYLDTTGLARERFGAVMGSLYLLRPDGHVLGRWHNAARADLLAGLSLHFEIGARAAETLAISTEQAR